MMHIPPPTHVNTFEYGKQLAKAVVDAFGEHKELNNNNSEQIVQKYCDDFVKGFISVSKKI
jgi:hypothetical protein